MRKVGGIKTVFNSNNLFQMWLAALYYNIMYKTIPISIFLRGFSSKLGTFIHKL